MATESHNLDVRETLVAQRDAWQQRPLVRALYQDWYRRIESRLATVPGPLVELGAGIGSFKDHHPATIATDAVETPWTDAVVDAQDLPYEHASVANLVMVDVLHHLPRPSRFFDEASRVLRPGGRVVMVEPYCSPVSNRVYRRFHHELTDLSADPFGDGPLSSGAPFDSNQALPTLIFWRELERFRTLHPALAVRRRERFAFFAYPLSGGFSKPPLLPAALGRALAGAERALGFAAPLLAFRCLVCLERRTP